MDTKKAPECGAVTKTQNIDMKSTIGILSMVLIQYFSIF